MQTRQTIDGPNRTTWFLWILLACGWFIWTTGGCEPSTPTEPSKEQQPDVVRPDSASTEQPKPRETKPDAPQVTGAALYQKYCALCHGDKGEGYKADGANALANQEFLKVATDAFLRNGIERGRPGTVMSAWGKAYGGPLNDQELDRLVTYIRSWQTEPSLNVHDTKVTGEIQRGKVQYEVRCESCHGKEGKGGTYMSLNNPEFLRDASDGFLLRAITKGRPGTPMPAYEGQMTPQAIKDLVVLIKSWRKDAPKPTPLPERTNTPMIINKGGGDAGFAADGRFVPAEKVKQAIDAGKAIIIIDARPPGDYIKLHIEGAISIPFYEADSTTLPLPKDTWIVSYCGCPHAESGKVYDALKKKGHTKIKVLDEGFYFWRDKPYPTRSGANP